MPGLVGNAAARVVKSIARAFYGVSMLGLDRGPHVTRYYMYRHLDANYHVFRPPHHRVLSLSHSEQLAKLLGYRAEQIIDASYPECSMLSLPFANEEFDAVVSDQVLEHVEGNPQQAVDESLRVLKPGGIVLHTTCFINPIHGAPRDFWRFTPEALRLLVAEKADIIDVGGWGNFFWWLFIFLGLRYQPIPHTRAHPAHWIATYNQPKMPVTTWVFARKRNLETGP